MARRVVTVVVALTVALSVTAAPIAAAPDDGGLLGGDDSDDGSLLGGGGSDDGLVSDDGVSVGGDSGVEVGTDGVSVGGDEGVNASTDGVSVAGQDVGTDSLGDAGDGSVPVGTDSLGDAGDGSVPVDTDSLGDVGDGSVPDIGSGSLPSTPGADGAPALTAVIGPEGALDTDDADIDLSRLDLLGPAPNVEGEQSRTATDTLSGSTEDLPGGTQQLPLDALPTDQVAGPQELPVGSESQLSCAKPINGEDLPTEAVPAVSDLPAQPPAVPGVPLSLLTPKAVGGLAVGVVPDPCKVYDPDNPSVDPTDPPTDPTGEVNTNQFRMTDEEAAYAGNSAGELEEGGPAWDSIWLITADGEEVRAVENFDATDGRTAGYVGLGSELRAQRDLSGFQGELHARVLGKNVGGGLECGDVTEAKLDYEQPTGPCSYEIDGVISPPLGPAGLVDTVQNPPSYELPQVDSGALPVDL